MRSHGEQTPADPPAWWLEEPVERGDDVLDALVDGFDFRDTDVYLRANEAYVRDKVGLCLNVRCWCPFGWLEGNHFEHYAEETGWAKSFRNGELLDAVDLTLRCDFERWRYSVADRAESSRASRWGEQAVFVAATDPAQQGQWVACVSRWRLMRRKLISGVAGDMWQDRRAGEVCGALGDGELDAWRDALRRILIAEFEPCELPCDIVEGGPSVRCEVAQEQAGVPISLRDHHGFLIDREVAAFVRVIANRYGFAVGLRCGLEQYAQVTHMKACTLDLGSGMV